MHKQQSPWRRRAVPLAAFLAGWLLGFLLWAGGTPPNVVCGALNTTYQVGGLILSFADGHNVFQYAPGAQAALWTYIDRIPVRGQLSQGVVGAAVVLKQVTNQGDESYYIAVAVLENGKIRGSNALPLGENLTVTAVDVADEMVWVHSVQFRPDASGRLAPGAVQVERFIWEAGKLIKAGA